MPVKSGNPIKAKCFFKSSSTDGNFYFTVLNLNTIWIDSDTEWNLFLRRNRLMAVFGNKGRWERLEEINVSITDIENSYANQNHNRDLVMDISEIKKSPKSSVKIDGVIEKWIPKSTKDRESRSPAELLFFLRKIDSKFIDNPVINSDLKQLGFEHDKSFNSHGPKNINPIVRLKSDNGEAIFIKREENPRAIAAERIIGELWVQLKWRGVNSRPELLADGLGLAIMAVGGQGIQDKGTFMDYFSHLPFENKSTMITNRPQTIRRITLDSLQLRNPFEVTRFVLVNAVTGNSDRHSANLKYGWSEEGPRPHGILLPIDHGRCLLNNVGQNGNSIIGDPADAVTGRIGNPHQLLRPMSQLLRKDWKGVNEDSIDWLEKVSEALTRMAANPLWKDYGQELNLLQDRVDQLTKNLPNLFSEILAVVR